MNPYQTDVHQPRESRAADTEQAYHDTKLAQFQRELEAREEVKKLTHDIQKMAATIGAEFVPDEQKINDYVAARCALGTVHRPYATGG